MNKSKIGFFRRVFLAVTDFRFYPQVIKESSFKAVGYFLKLILISSALIALYTLHTTLDFISNDMKDYAKKIPDFYVENGEMHFDEETKLELNSFVSLYMKNDYSNNIDSSFIPEDKLGVVVTKDKILFGNKSDSSALLSFSDVDDISKQELMTNLESIDDSFSNKLLIYIAILFSTIIYVLINRIWLLLMYILLVLVCNILFVVKMKFRGFVKIAIYISTLPILLETFAICIGGKYTQSAEFVTFLIAGVYAFYSLRYIRISDVLIRATRKNNRRKNIKCN